MILVTLFNAVIYFFTSIYFLLFVGVVLWICVFVHLYMTRNFGKWEKKYGFKGIKPVPFFGTEKDFLMATKPLNDTVLDKYHAFEGHKFGVMYQGSRPAIFVRDLELLKNICFTDFDHFTDFFDSGIESVVDNNLFFVTGEKWKKSKVALSMVFRNKHVKDVLPKINISINKTLNQLESFTKTGEDIRFDNDIVDIFLLDAVGHAVCGVDFGVTKDPNNEISQMTQRLNSSAWRFLLLNIAPGLMTTFGIQVFDPTATNYLDKLLRQLLKEHKDKKIFDDLMGVLVKVKLDVDAKKTTLSTTGEDYIPLTDEMILSSCMQFFFDGVVTMATMINTAVYYLAQNPDMQEKAYEEIQNVLGDRMSSPDSEKFEDLPEITDNDLLEMKFIDQVFYEASRLGAFPFIFRNCTKDYPMPGTDFVVPKGTPMFIPIIGFHTDPKYFPEPEKFIPERFAPENKDKLVKGAYCPFGQGPRMCLGMTFIRMEGKAFLANLIRNYKIHESEKTIKKLDWEPEMASKIKGGFYIKLSKRDN